MDGDTARQEVGSAGLREPSRARTACFALFVGLTLAAFSTPLSKLVRFALQQEQYSHIILVPLVSAALLFWNEKESSPTSRRVGGWDPQ